MNRATTVQQYFTIFQSSKNDTHTSIIGDEFGCESTGNGKVSNLVDLCCTAVYVRGVFVLNLLIVEYECLSSFWYFLVGISSIKPVRRPWSISIHIEHPFTQHLTQVLYSIVNQICANSAI